MSLSVWGGVGLSVPGEAFASRSLLIPDAGYLGPAPQPLGEREARPVLSFLLNTRDGLRPRNRKERGRMAGQTAVKGGGGRYRSPGPVWALPGELPTGPPEPGVFGSRVHRVSR